MMVIRSSQVPSDGTPETEHDADPFHEQAAELFAGNSRRAGFPRCALSARSSTSARPGRSGCETTSPLELQRRVESPAA
jgi:hypothetical protein